MASIPLSKLTSTRREVEMNGKLKSFSLVLVMFCTLNAVSASAASAAEFHSGSASGTTYLTGQQFFTNQIDTEGGTIRCSFLKLSGSYSGTTASEVTLI